MVVVVVVIVVKLLWLSVCELFYDGVTTEVYTAQRWKRILKERDLISSGRGLDEVRSQQVPGNGETYMFALTL